jgi:hypothetical protein
MLFYGLTVIAPHIGAYGFFEKCGFKKMGPPIMCGPDNTVEDVS